MANYQLWLLNEDYTRAVYLDRWLRLSYRLGLNQMCGASVDLAADDPKIEDIALMQRLLVLRDGEVVFGGLIQNEAWRVSENAPRGDIYALDALDYTCYLDWRTIPRPSGQDYDFYEDHADDVAKAVVRAHAGSNAPPERRFSDLAVAADVHAVAPCQRSFVGNTLLEELIALSRLKKFYWRVVPGLHGCTFTTYYPLAGVDRTKGNGVHDELVFALDRHNVQSMSYRKDLSNHYNTIYVAGPGEGKDQMVVERQNASYVSAYKRRERWVSASNYSTVAGLQGVGDQEIEAHKPVEVMHVVPSVGGLSPANLGDKVTIFARRYGRSFRMDAVITALEIEVNEDGIEHVAPEMERV